MIKHIKKYWRTAVEVLGLLGLLFALLQLILQKQQFEYEQQIFAYEQAKWPQLEYSQRLEFSTADDRAISQAAQQLIEDFYASLYEYKAINEGSDYSSAVKAVLPITSTITTKPVSVVIVIENKGEGTATKVRMVLEMDRPITSLDVESLEPYEVIGGGPGSSSITVEIDRIVSDQSVIIAVASESVEQTSQVDQLVVEMDTRGGGMGIVTAFTYDEQDRLLTRTATMYADSGLFPQVRYIPAEQPEVTVTVTSNEGPARFLGVLEFGSEDRR